MAEGNGRIAVSVVVPVYLGAAYLRQLVEALDKVRSGWAAPDAPIELIEAVLVDDAARDASPQIIDELTKAHPWVVGLHLSRNFGQHPATIAGILHTAGDWVVTLDEDLQHPPERIAELLRHAAQGGHDVVYARPREGVHGPLRDLGSKMSKRIMRRLSGNPNITAFNSFRLVRGPVARAAASVCGYETYLDVALSWFSERVSAVTMDLTDHRVASGGRSGYQFKKLLSHGRRLLMSSGTKFIRLGGLVGVAALIGSIVLALFIIIRELLFPGSFLVRGWASLMTASVFFGGVITFQLGIALEYLGLLVSYRQGRPVFFAVDRSNDRILVDYFSAGRG